MRPISVLFFFSLFACVGCEQLKIPIRSNFIERDLPLNSTIESQATARNLSQVVASQRTQPAVLTCQKDKNGNAIKVIVANHNAAMYSDHNGTELIRRCTLLEKSYLFGRQENRLHIGENPRLKGVAWIDESDTFVVSHMQWVQLNPENRKIRPPVAGFPSLKDLEAFIAGKDVKPALLESQLSESAKKSSWMPILDSRVLMVGNTKVPVLELGAFTLRQCENNRDTNATLTTTPNRLSHSELQDAMAQFRIVLCVDATSSMQIVWSTMAQHLREIIGKTLQDRTLNVQFAIVAYRDDDPASGWPYKASTFTADREKLETWTNRVKPVGGGDWSERVFEALLVSTDLLALPEHRSAYKKIVLVGDNAGHIDSEEPDIGSVGKKVLDRCEEHSISISSLQMPYHPKFTGDKALFGEQLKILTGKTGGIRFEVSANDNDENKTGEAIVAALLATKAEVLIESKIASDLNEGLNWEEIRHRTDLPEAALTWHIKNVHHRLEGRIKINDNLDLGVDSVFVIQDQRAFNAGVLVPAFDLELLIAVLDRLITLSADKPTSLAELWGQLASQNTGEDVPLSEALRVESTLPVRDNLLSISLSELIVMPRAQRQAWAAEVEKKFNALVAWKSANEAENGNYIVPISVLP